MAPEGACYLHGEGDQPHVGLLAAYRVGLHTAQPRRIPPVRHRSRAAPNEVRTADHLAGVSLPVRKHAAVVAVPQFLDQRLHRLVYQLRRRVLRENLIEEEPIVWQSATLSATLFNLTHGQHCDDRCTEQAPAGRGRRQAEASWRIEPLANLLLPALFVIE